MNSRKPTFCDRLAVGLVKVAEGESPPAAGDIPTDLAPPIFLDGKGRKIVQKNEKIAEAYLIARSHRLLKSRVGIGPRRLRIACWAAFWIPVAFVLFLGVLIYPLSRADHILGAKMVNLAGPYFWFMALQSFFLAISLFFLPYAIIQTLWSVATGSRGVKTDPNRPSFFSQLTQRLAFFSGFFGSVLLCTLQGIWIVWNRLWRRDRNPRNRSEIQESLTGGSEMIFGWLFAHQRTFLFFGSLLSHLFWASLSTVVLVILFSRMWGNQYDYCWRSSLIDAAEVESIVGFATRPLPPFIKVPDKRDIEWLFENASTHPTGKGASSVGGTAAQSSDRTESVAVEAGRIRKEWSYFLLMVVLFWGVIPRGVLVGFYSIFFWLSLREFRPDPNDPYYRNLLDSARSLHPNLESQVIDDGASDDGQFVPKPILPHDASGEKSHPSEITAQKIPADHTLVLGYDAAMSAAQWESILGPDPKRVVLGNIAESRESLQTFAEQFVPLAPTIGRTILLTDASASPARQLRLWLQNELFAKLPASENFVLLSCGERLRRRFADAPNDVATRLAEWNEVLRQMAEWLSVSIMPISFYDHEIDTDDARRKLAEHLGETDFARKNRDSHNDLFPKACAMIESLSTEFFAESKSPLDEKEGKCEAYSASVQRRLATTYGKIAELYRQGDSSAIAAEPSADGANRTSSWWSDSLTRLTELPAQLGENVAEKIRKQDWSADDFTARFAPVVALLERAERFRRRLSPRCAVAFGLVGASLPLLAAAAPMVAGTAGLGGTLTALSTLLPASVATGLVGTATGALAPLSLETLREKIREALSFGKPDFREGDLSEPPDESPQTTSNDLVATAVQTLGIWTAVLELQGVDVETVAAAFPDILRPLEESWFESPADVTAALGQLGERLERFRTQGSPENERMLHG